MTEKELKQKLKNAYEAILKAKLDIIKVSEEDEHYINDEFHIKKAHHYIQYRVFGISTLLDSAYSLINDLNKHIDRFK